MLNKSHIVRCLAACLAAALVCARIAPAVEVGVEANPLEAAEKYGTTSFVIGSNGVASVLFLAQSPFVMPDLQLGGLHTDVDVSQGAFVGNYAAAGVAGLSFRVRGDGHLPGGADVVLRSGSGRKWMNRNVQVSINGNLWFVNNLSLDRAAGWDRNEPGSVDKDALWNADLQDVAYVGLRFSQGGMEAQMYTVDAVTLVGADGFPVPAGTLTGFQVSLLDRFGVESIDKLTSTQKAQDIDEDRMTDVNELLAGTNPDDYLSVFAAEIVAMDADGVVLRWPCVAGSEYAVLRTSDLMDGFQVLEAGLVAAETGYMTYQDTGATGSGPYFYRVMKLGE